QRAGREVVMWLGAVGAELNARIERERRAVRVDRGRDHRADLELALPDVDAADDVLVDRVGDLGGAAQLLELSGTLRAPERADLGRDVRERGRAGHRLQPVGGSQREV